MECLLCDALCTFVHIIQHADNRCTKRHLQTITGIKESRAINKQSRGDSRLCVEPVKRLLNELHLILEILDFNLVLLVLFQIANNPCANLLTAHFRLDGHPNVNYLEKVIQNSAQSYLFFEPSQVILKRGGIDSRFLIKIFVFFSQGDLHSHVRVRKRLRENEARRLFRQMCEVVKTCHEQGIVLRDLKLRKFVFADSERWVASRHLGHLWDVYRNPL